MGKKTSTRYPWGTERPASKLEKLQAQHGGWKRDLAIIRARAARDEAKRLQQSHIEIAQIYHIKMATLYGPYNRKDAASHPWTDTCTNQDANQHLAKCEKTYLAAKNMRNEYDVEISRNLAYNRVVVGRVCKLAESIGKLNDNIRDEIKNLVPHDIPKAIRLLGLQPISDEVYFAFHGFNEILSLPDGTCGHPDFDLGWYNSNQPPKSIEAVFPHCDIPAFDDINLLSENEAWLWLEVALFDGLGVMPPPWKEEALKPHGGNAVRALAAELRRNPDLASKYYIEAYRQYVWPFFVERREKIRFFLRLYHWWCLDIKDMYRAISHFDESFIFPWSDAAIAKSSTFSALVPIFDKVFELLPWPEGFGRHGVLASQQPETRTIPGSNAG